jgi:hypothetical protein
VTWPPYFDILSSFIPAWLVSRAVGESSLLPPVGCYCPFTSRSRFFALWSACFR